MWSIYARLRKVNRRQQGQALPLVLVALFFGALVVTPFLNQVGGALLGSRQYHTITSETYAADAGIEHAVWRLQYDGLAAVLPNVGNTANYVLPNQVNDITPSITVANIQSGAGSPAGTITDTIINSYEFDAADGAKPCIIHISGTVYAIAYTGSGRDGWLKTVNIAADGTITQSTISSYEFDTGTGFEPRIIHISGNVYAIAYRGPGNDGFLKTVTIAANGVITQATISTYEFDASNCVEPDIIHISGDVYAVAYTGPGSDGFLKTVTIAANGVITQATISTYEFDTADCAKPEIIHIFGNIYAIVYTGSQSDGFLKTVTIAANGIITQATIDTWEFNTTNGADCEIFHVSGDIYGIAYRGAVNTGNLMTLTINTNGTIVKSAISSTAFDGNQGYEPNVLYIGGDVYAISYRDAAADGVLKTFQIQTNGIINGTPVDTLVFDAGAGYEPWIINVGIDSYAIAYRGPQGDGWLCTVGVTQNGSGGTAIFSVQSIASNITITAVVSINGLTATIDSWLITKP